MAEDKKNLLGERLILLRQESGLTQEKLAEIFKTKKATISRYETGTRDPKLDTLIEFADFFKVSTDYLLGRTENRKRL
jgi:transcriptional regulator with XRE-family HTH domain